MFKVNKGRLLGYKGIGKTLSCHDMGDNLLKEKSR